jgi:hypothetical protein
LKINFNCIKSLREVRLLSRVGLEYIALSYLANFRLRLLFAALMSTSPIDAIYMETLKRGLLSLNWKGFYRLTPNGSLFLGREHDDEVIWVFRHTRSS